MDFFAPWCVWCQRLAPTWEKFAEDVEANNVPITVAKVDCVAEPELCKSQRVMAFPTLRFFKVKTVEVVVSVVAVTVLIVVVRIRVAVVVAVVLI